MYYLYKENHLLAYREPVQLRDAVCGSPLTMASFILELDETMRSGRVIKDRSGFFASNAYIPVEVFVAAVNAIDKH
jgi:hypothetical protein